MRRRALLAGAIGVGTSPAAAQGGPPALGWLMIQGRADRSGWLTAFETGLADLGQTKGKTYVIRESYADGDAARLPALATTLAGSDVAVIVATSQPACDAARRATATVPIVGRMSDDPVQGGAARSLAHPAGNVTGVYSLLEGTSLKRLELLQQTVPGLAKVGALLTLGRGATRQWLAEAETAARAMGLSLHVMDVNSAGDLDSAFAAAATAGVQGVVGFRNPTIVTHYRQVVELSSRYRLPTITDESEVVEAGGLMSYGPSLDAIFHRLAFYVDRILKGSKPADLPIQQPTTFEFVINLGTARTLGLSIPPSILARADRVIE